MRRATVRLRPQPVFLGLPPRMPDGDEPPPLPPTRPVPVVPTLPVRVVPTRTPPKPPRPKDLSSIRVLPPVIKLPGGGKPETPVRQISAAPGPGEAYPPLAAGTDGLNASVTVSALPFGLSMPVLLGGAGLALCLVTRSSGKK